MKEIQLTKGLVARVSDEDYAAASAFVWHAVECRGICYAARWLPGMKRLYLHRFLMHSKVREEVDHVDGNGLNCTRENMRIATHRQNMLARRSGRPRGYSRFRGVTWRKSDNRWVAKTTVNGKAKHLGLFKSEVDAAVAFDNFAREEYGEFARLNFASKVTNMGSGTGNKVAPAVTTLGSKPAISATSPQHRPASLGEIASYP